MKRIPVRRNAQAVACIDREFAGWPISATRSIFGARFRVAFQPNSKRFGSSVHEIRAFAGPVRGIVRLKVPPNEWKNTVTPSIVNSSRL
jgi:hypothetical protein